MNLEGFAPPSGPEVFEIIEEDREQFYQETVALRALLRRAKNWHDQIAQLESRIADLTSQLQEAGVPVRDTPPPQEVGSTDPPDTDWRRTEE